MKKLIIIAMLAFSTKSNSQDFIKASGTQVAKLENEIPTLTHNKDEILRILEMKLDIASHTFSDCSVGKFEDGYFISLFTIDDTRTSVNLKLDGEFLLICGLTSCTTTSCANNYTRCQVSGKACTPCDMGTKDCRRSSSIIAEPNPNNEQQ